MMNSGFGDIADPTIGLYPADLREEIDALNARIYPSLDHKRLGRFMTVSYVLAA